MMQYYVKAHKTSIFENNRLPQLIYIANTEDMKEYLPRMLHKHDDHLEIVFVVKGEGIHFIGGKKYHTKAGDILIFNPNVLHDETAQMDSNMEVYCCGISQLYIKGMEPNHLFNTKEAAVIFSGEQQEIIHKILDIMFFHIKTSRQNANELCHYLLSSLLSILVELPKNHQRNFNIEKQTIMNKVRSYLEQNFTQTLSLEEIAERFKISPFYLSRLFKEEIGFSPIQYLNRLRIGAAQSLLMETNLPITQIAIDVGYENITYFSTFFSKMTGVTPTLYRDLWIGKTLL